MAFDNRNEPYLIELSKNRDPRGNLSVIESGVDVPFKVMRNYWI